VGRQSSIQEILGLVISLSNLDGKTVAPLVPLTALTAAKTNADVASL